MKTLIPVGKRVWRRLLAKADWIKALPHVPGVTWKKGESWFYKILVLIQASLDLKLEFPSAFEQVNLHVVMWIWEKGLIQSKICQLGLSTFECICNLRRKKTWTQNCLGSILKGQVNYSFIRFWGSHPFL